MISAASGLRAKRQKEHKWLDTWRGRLGPPTLYSYSVASKRINDGLLPPGDGAVDVEFAERCEQLSREIGPCVSSEQLGTSDDGAAEAVTFRPELASTSEVVDEDVGVDEQISHVASHRATGHLRRVMSRRWH